ncbi:uncharacterized protein ACB057_010489 [Neosynchiropus ocellatus]
MLAKILEEMWVEPAVLEALSEEQKRILFLKMREEQVRRWREREEREGPDVCSRPKKAAGKHVSWLLGRDGDISVSVIGERDEPRASGLPQRRAHHRCHSDRGTIAESTEQRSDSRSSEEETDSCKDPGEDSDSESGSSSDNLGDWPPLHRPHLSHHGNTAPLKAPLSEAELVGSEDREPACLQRSNGGRVAQLRRAFTADPHSLPSSTASRPPGPVRPARSHGRTAALIH